MSGRFGNSPALRLRIGDSRLRAVLHAALCACVGAALWVTGVRAHLGVSLLLLPLAVMLLWQLRRDTAAGAQVCWHSGTWTLEQAGESKVVVVGRRSIVMPWAIHLSFTEPATGAGRELWVFVDSVPRAQLRQLRVRLALAQG